MTKLTIAMASGEWKDYVASPLWKSLGSGESYSMVIYDDLKAEGDRLMGMEALRDASTFNGLSAVMMGKGKERLKCCSQRLEQALSDGWRLLDETDQWSGSPEAYALALKIQEKFTRHHKPPEDTNMLKELIALSERPNDLKTLGVPEIVALGVFGGMMQLRYDELDLKEPPWLSETLEDLNEEIPRRRLEDLTGQLKASEAEESRLMSNKDKLVLAKKRTAELKKAINWEQRDKKLAEMEE